MTPDSTRPSPPQNAMTMGMVEDACFAAMIAGGLTAMMTSTFALTSSAASLGRRSKALPAERVSIVYAWPST